MHEDRFVAHGFMLLKDGSWAPW